MPCGQRRKSITMPHYSNAHYDPIMHIIWYMKGHFAILPLCTITCPQPEPDKGTV